jgi:uncharacterized protein (TIGR02271 family)
MRMIAHSYDTYDQAARAVNALEAAGVPHDDISVVSGDKTRNTGTAAGVSTTGTDTDATAPATGTGASIGTLLGGGAGLLAGIGALAIPGIGPVVAAGWLIATLTGAGVGAAAGGLLGSLTGAGVDAADAQTYSDHVGRGGTLVTVRASDDMAAQAEYILEHGEARATTGVAAAPAMTAPAMAAPVRTGPAVAPAPRMGTAATATGADGKIEVVKENLVVGKREVEQGGVNITSRIVETPAEAEVRLREERIVVDRRPINRPLTGNAADVFRERTLSMNARSEEAVVGKEARVVEEIDVHKEAAERVETVRDTVRETKVDVNQVPGSTGTARTGASGTGVGTGTGTAGTSPVRDNAATRAVDNTLGTNVSGQNPTNKV